MEISWNIFIADRSDYNAASAKELTKAAHIVSTYVAALSLLDGFKVSFGVHQDILSADHKKRLNFGAISRPNEWNVHCENDQIQLEVSDVLKTCWEYEIYRAGTE